jgi:hypothetical protein
MNSLISETEEKFTTVIKEMLLLAIYVEIRSMEQN